MKKTSLFNNQDKFVTVKNISFIFLTVLILLYGFFDITTSVQTYHNNYDRTASKVLLISIIAFSLLMSFIYILIGLKNKKKIFSYMFGNYYYILISSFAFIGIGSLLSVIVNKQNISVLGTPYTYYFSFISLSLFFKLVTYENNYSKKIFLYCLLTIFFFYYFFLIFYFFYTFGKPMSSGNLRIPVLSHVFFPLSTLPLLRIYLKTKVFIIYGLFLPIIFLSDKASVFIIFILIVIFDIVTTKKTPKIKKIVTIGSVICGGAFALLLLIANIKPGTFLYNKFSFNAIFVKSERFQNWVNICKNIPSFSFLNYLFGKGVGATLLINKGIAAHNDFLEFFYDCGLVGFLGICLLILYFFVNSFSKKKGCNKSNNRILFMYYFVLAFVSAIFTNNNILLSLSTGNPQFDDDKDLSQEKLIKLAKINKDPNNYNCVECHSCEMVCNEKAISFKPNINSYLYPVINDTKCIKCNKCKSVCQLYDKKNKVKEIDSSLIFSEDSVEKSLSSSGGFCFNLAKFFVANKGIVYASIFDKDKKTVKFNRFSSDKDLNKIKGSKYVKSNIEDSFIKIINDLIKKRDVLFIGTACEIYGLKLFLKKKFNNLTTVSLLCGGTVSQELFKLYLTELERKFEKHIIDINFRTKIKDDNWFNTSIKFDDNTIVLLKEKDNCYIKIVGSYYRRPSCLVCNDKIDQIHFDSNITVGDYHRKSKNEKFSSLVFIKERNGLINIFLKENKKLYKFINNDEAVNKAVYKKDNKERLTEEEYKKFFDDFKNKGSYYAFKKHIYSRFSLKKKISYKTPKILKRMIKRGK